MGKLNLLDVLKTKKLQKFIGLDFTNFIENSKGFDIVIDNGDESKVLVSESLELTVYQNSISRAKLNLVDSQYFIDVKVNKRIVLNLVSQKELKSWLDEHNIPFDLSTENLNGGFVEFSLEDKVRIYYDIYKESIFSRA